jgi:hypothetical protein
LRRVVWQFADVPEVLAASIIRAMKMEAAIPLKRGKTYTRLHGATSHMTATFIPAAVRISNPTYSTVTFK